MVPPNCAFQRKPSCGCAEFGCDAAASPRRRISRPTVASHHVIRRFTPETALWTGFPPILHLRSFSWSPRRISRESGNTLYRPLAC